MDLYALGRAIALTCVVSIPLALSLWALLDAARRPQWALAFSGRRQVVWMAAILLLSFTLVPGMAVSAWYLRKVRPLVAAAEEGRVD